MAQTPAWILGNTNSFNTLNTHNNINVNAGTDVEKRQVLHWLSSLEPQQRHHTVRTDRIDGVGNWLLETEEFRKWNEASTSTDGGGGGERVLFCYGDPGVGKTYLR
ncbi:hypothetical protein L873DRAFT_1700214 [Choiromyces venosus 120613-1]|uniref:Nephrocystin 3-like N-terminal domain-containing protein n=1 Tax=Choiromyces venosus 120613-1 TaxID=1336337 RepID=A0A3N4J8Z4_9PEZI|nr:hypothetical protein L873DRAFT_1700214 [Choiromyces venosus 120613-1]